MPIYNTKKNASNHNWFISNYVAYKRRATGHVRSQKINFPSLLTHRIGYLPITPKVSLANVGTR